MRPELKEFFRGITILLIGGFILTMIISPESFGGWILVIFFDLIILALIKAATGQFRGY